MLRKRVEIICFAITILAFLGVASIKDVIGNIWLTIIGVLGLIFLMYGRADLILKSARFVADSYFRFRLGLKIIEPNPQQRVTADRFRILGTYRVKPDPEKIRVFHRANGDYFLQDKINFWPNAHRGSNWFADVHVIRVKDFAHDIVIARCSDDNLVNLRYFDYVKRRTGHHYGIPGLHEGPGFCILLVMPVPFAGTTQVIA